MADLPAAWRFTPPEGGARLSAACCLKNTLATLTPQHAAFIAIKLIHESANDIRRPLSAGGKRSVIIAQPRRLQNVAGELTRLTDLSVLLAELYSDCQNWAEALEEKQVLMVTSEVLSQIIDEGLIGMKNFNVLVVDGCHIVSKDMHLQNIMKLYYEWRTLNDPLAKQLRILALTFPLFVKDSIEKINSENITNYKTEISPKIEKNIDSIEEEETPDAVEVKGDEKCSNTIIEDVNVVRISLEYTDSDRSLINILEVNRPSCKIIELKDDTETDLKDGNKDDESKESSQDINDLNIESLKIENEEKLQVSKSDGCDEEIEIKHRDLQGASNQVKVEPSAEITVAVENVLNELVNDENVHIDKVKEQNGEILQVKRVEIEKNETVKVDKEENIQNDKLEKQLIVNYLKLANQNKSMELKCPISEYQKLECQLEYLEKQLYCKVDLAEDVDGVKRLGEKPHELIIECEDLQYEKLHNDYRKLDSDIRKCVADLSNFFYDHRFDLSEIYGDMEEFKSIPNPALEPLNLLDQFIECLDQLGPYGADKAAFCLLSKLEKLKVKVPYERHFLLLGLCTTMFTKIRRIIDLVLEDVDMPLNKFTNYCTPKLHRLIELLKQFTPEYQPQKIDNSFNATSKQDAAKEPSLKLEKVSQVNPDQPLNDNIVNDAKMDGSKLLESIDDCDFKGLGEKIEGKCKMVMQSNQERSGREKANSNDVPTRDANRMTQPDNSGRKRPHGWRIRGRGKDRNNANYMQNPDALCGVIFVQKPLMAKVLFMLISEYSHCSPELSFLSAQYSAIDKPADPQREPKDAEHQRKVQEEVLKRFRIHECNLLIATPMLEEGIDLPKCNLMLRWDPPNGYRSYTRCRARARAPHSISALLAGGSLSLGSPDVTTASDQLLRSLATYAELDMMFKRKCGSGTREEQSIKEEKHADRYTHLIEPYSPSSATNTMKKDAKMVNGIPNNNTSNPVDKLNDKAASVNLSSAVSLINKYCAKLPSDTFTRLVPHSTVESLRVKGGTIYICTLRLPINCPVKYNIVGHPMPTEVLARRMTALQACRILHLSGELDNQLMPIGKEHFASVEGEWEAMLQSPVLPAVSSQPDTPTALDAPRPGTTKRRQYYYKRTARALCDCRPQPDSGEVLLYVLDARLQCPLPERHNTRGRRLHAPEKAAASLAILTSKHINKIPGFPIYTRSGEVGIQIRCIGQNGANSEQTLFVREGQKLDAKLTPHRISLIHSFMRYLYGDVLRVRRQGMPLDSRGIRRAANYYIVPTINITDSDGSRSTNIDWNFLETIFSVWRSSRTDSSQPLPGTDSAPRKVVNPNLGPDEKFVFDADKYKDAVVTPWYRNHDQPQYFYVAEICHQLSPQSAFPQDAHESFFAYYLSKYSVAVTELEQPLLDVDHTSARLNLLTPRYVSRKGVALPVSSERTRRAKRDRLDQKQILVPELCSVHPFSGALWRCAVALPCILYRINALLLADEIRRSVALEMGVGTPDLIEGKFESFHWPSLNFGWSLADVLNDDKNKSDQDASKTATEEKTDSKDCNAKDLEATTEDGSGAVGATEAAEKEKPSENPDEKIDEDGNAFEIGTWSNDIAEQAEKATKVRMDIDIDMDKLPTNLVLCNPDITGVSGWGDPVGAPFAATVRKENDANRKYRMADSDDSYMSSDFDTSFDSDLDSDVESDSGGMEIESAISHGAPTCGVRIEFKNHHEAEAIDIVSTVAKVDQNRSQNLHPEISAKADEKEMDGLLKQFLEYFYGNGELAENDNIRESIENFKKSVHKHENRIRKDGTMVSPKQSLSPILKKLKNPERKSGDKEMFKRCHEYMMNDFKDMLEECEMLSPELRSLTSASVRLYKELFLDGKLDRGRRICEAVLEKQFVSLVDLEKNKLELLERIKTVVPKEKWKDFNCFSMKACEVPTANVPMEIGKVCMEGEEWTPNNRKPDGLFDFDFQPILMGHPGPSPSAILQALTMSNANDGINLERLETIGDSFLKYAITAYLYCVRPHVHEGKLSHMRSKQVSNLNLYRLGRAKRLGTVMIATKFEPHDNWLPPSHRAPKGSGTQAQQANDALTGNQNGQPTEQIWCRIYEDYDENCPQHGVEAIKSKIGIKMPTEGAIAMEPCTCKMDDLSPEGPSDTDNSYFVPYNLITQHSIPDKSVADCVEALIGAYLIECGPRGALLFMSWLGIRVLPKYEMQLPTDHPYINSMTVTSESSVADVPSDPELNLERPCDEDDLDSDADEDWSESERIEGLDEEPFQENWSWPGRIPGSLKPYRHSDGSWYQTVYGSLVAPPSPLLRHVRDPEGELEKMLSGYEKLEATLKYRFRDRALMLQAMTHASHSHNRLTDCYQRLEFLGDAVLDYLITRYLYEDKRRHSPGALTDLRSALVNNTIFASLAVRHGFHKFFRHMSPGLNEVLAKFVRIQEDNGHSISEEHYLIQEDELEQAEDVEVPKALGDLFESIAGAIYLDSGLSLSAVWGVYHGLMAPELEAFSASVPKSPVRELLEAEPETAKFSKPERLADGRRVRVTVEVFGRGTFKGVGRNYRIAKCTAARCALRHLAKPVQEFKYKGR